MKKITVKHYINNRLKSKPLYVRVIYDRKDTTFPSEITSNVFPTEDQFLSDPVLKREMEYESEIITSIIKFCIERQKDKFTFSQVNFSYLIHEWKRSISDKYYSKYIDNKSVRDEIRNPLLEFISEKTMVKVETIDKLITHSLSEIDAMLDLVKNHNIYPEDVKNTLLFNELLYKYEDVYYGSSDKRWVYGADNMFGFYEWNNKNGKDEFEKYAIKQDILSKEFVRMRILDFDKKLQEGLESSIFFSTFSDTERSRK